MLVELTLKNIVLIEEAIVPFGLGLNIISGETGAGKTILIEAISYLLGQKANPDIIRSGAEKGIIEGVFDIPEIAPYLEEIGIEPDEHLMIKREINRQGKSRAFINSQMVPLNTLQTIGPNLFEMVGQHVTTSLRSLSSQLAIIDNFGKTSLQSCIKAKNQVTCLENELTTLKGSGNNLELYTWQLEELNALAIQPNEEKLISEKISNLYAHKDRLQKLSTLVDLLNTDLPTKLSTYSDACLGFKLEDAADHLKTASLSLLEASYTLSNTLSDAEFDDNELQELENRLSKIHTLQKKYGPNLDEVWQNLDEKVNALSNLGQTLEVKENELYQAKVFLKEAEEKLHSERLAAGIKLSHLVTKELSALNMQGAEFKVLGCEFYLRANVGEALAPVKDRSSGGELSRLLFILKVLLKESTPTLILDELDANIGGETAAIFGEKLKALGKHRQIVCITHFPQVAKQGSHHLRAAKRQHGGRTLATITELKGPKKAEELLRMLGGTKIL